MYELKNYMLTVLFLLLATLCSREEGVMGSILPSTGLQGHEIRDVVSSDNTGSNWFKSKYINIFSRNKPVIDENINIIRNSDWWRSHYNNCGIILPKIVSGSELVTSLQWQYQRPNRDNLQPLRNGDFLNYNPNAKTMLIGVLPNYLYTDRENFFYLSIKDRTNDNVEILTKDICVPNEDNGDYDLPLSNLKFGVLLNNKAFKETTVSIGYVQNSISLSVPASVISGLGIANGRSCKCILYLTSGRNRYSLNTDGINTGIGDVIVDTYTKTQYDVNILCDSYVGREDYFSFSNLRIEFDATKGTGGDYNVSVFVDGYDGTEIESGNERWNISGKVSSGNKYVYKLPIQYYTTFSGSNGSKIRVYVQSGSTLITSKIFTQN